MRRSAEERSQTIKRWKLHNQLAHDDDASHCICDQQPNRFRKGQKVAGCHRVKCWSCQWEKIFKVPTMQTLKSDIQYREGVFEVFNVGEPHI